MANRPRYKIVELYSTADLRLPRFVEAARAGEPAPWRTTWKWRHRLPGRLAEFFRSLTTEPVERTLLGGSVQLTEKEARAIVAIRLAEISRMSGCPTGEFPDFILNTPAVNVGRRGRPCVLVEGGTVTTYPSIAAMGRAEGVTRKTASRRLRRLPTRRGKATF